MSSRWREARRRLHVRELALRCRERHSSGRGEVRHAAVEVVRPRWRMVSKSRPVEAFLHQHGSNTSAGYRDETADWRTQKTRQKTGKEKE